MGTMFTTSRFGSINETCMVQIMYAMITGSVAKASSAIVTGLTQKFYLETNLVKVQIYMEDLPNVVQSLHKKGKHSQACRVDKLIHSYTSLVLSDEYLQVKTGADTFECFPIHTKYKRGGKIIYTLKIKKYADTWMDVSEEHVYLGVHAPLCPMKCGSISTVSFQIPSQERRWKSREPDSGTALQNFYNAWSNIEMLKLEIEAILKDIQLSEALEF